jgi:(p)ppGpp synthase/HD superfamily hydrolase
MPMTNNPIPPDTCLLYRASNLASQLHRHQLRKDGVTPYIAHLHRVAMHLRHVFGCDDPTILAAGLLHDAIEDTTADFDEIAEATTPGVASLVAALTKDMRLPEAEREAAYDQQLAAAPWQARLIKLADVYDNLCDSILSSAPVKIQDKVTRALSLADTDPRLARAANLLRILAGLPESSDAEQ